MADELTTIIIEEEGNNTQEPLPEGSSFTEVFKNISSLSIPMALSYTFSFEVFLSSVLLAMANTEDEQELAAIALIVTMMNTMIIMGLSPLFGMSILGSHKIGELNQALEQEEDEARIAERRDYIAQYNKNGLVISAAMIPVIAGPLYFAESILTHIFQQDPATAHLAQNFLRPYSLAVPAIMSRMCFEQIMFSFGCPKPAMIMGLSSLSVGTAISAILGFGLLGNEKYGSAGIAAGFVVEAYLTSLMYGRYISSHPKFADYRFFDLCRHAKDWSKQLQSLLKLAAPIMFGIANELASSLSIGMISGLIGPSEQAAMSATMQCVFFSFILTSAFGQASSQEMSRAIGAQQYRNAHTIAQHSLTTAMIYSMPLPILCAVYPRILTISDNTANYHLQEILKHLMPIVAAGVITDSARYNLLQQLRALGDVNASTMISVAGLLSGVLASYFLGTKTNLGIYGVGAGYSSGITLSGAALFYRWSKQSRTKQIQDADTRSKMPLLSSSASSSSLDSLHMPLFKRSKSTEEIPARINSQRHSARKSF